MAKKGMYLAAAGAGLLIALVLGGCGGGSDNDGGNAQAANPGASDPFFQRVLALVGSSPDNTEPVSIDNISATTPDNIEPASL